MNEPLRTVRMVSLYHIKKVGFAAWKNRKWWSARKVIIWSNEHGAWWRPEGKGYTGDRADAWAVDFLTAWNYTQHCGPEKKINYCALPSQERGRAE